MYPFDQVDLNDPFGKDTDHRLSVRHEVSIKVSKGAKIRNRYNQGPHLTQDTNGKVTNSVKHHKREPRGQPFPSR